MKILMRFTVKILTGFICISLAVSTFAQTPQQINQKKEQLQKEMNNLQNEIKKIEALMKKTTKQKSQNEALLKSLKSKIKQQETQMASYNKQIKEIQGSINTTQTEINEKDRRAESLRKDYAQLLRKSYSNMVVKQKTNFLISSSGFNKAIAKAGYLRQIAGSQMKESNLVKENIALLVGQKSDLERSKLDKEMQLKKQELQKQELQKQEKTTNQTIAQLDEKQQKIKKLIDQKNKAAQELNAKIERIIKYEIDMARQRAEEAARKKALAEAKKLAEKTKTAPKPIEVKKEDIVLLTPKEMEVSKDFVSNRGRLPWPVASGAIVSRFGKQEHPTVKNVFIENNGVDIKTSPGAAARAILEGTVVSVFTMPTTQTCIIIKHGDYYTVYSNIQNATVKANQTVSTKQTIGTLYTDPSDNVTKVHLEIWKGKDKLNPSDWIAR